MGKVFLGARDRDGQQVAIKVLPPKTRLEEEPGALRFRREMDLSQPGPAPEPGADDRGGSEGDIYFMVMEYIPGRASTRRSRGRGGDRSASPTPPGSSSRCSTAWALRTPGGWSIATSSRETSWSRPRAMPRSSTSAWPALWGATRGTPDPPQRRHRYTRLRQPRAARQCRFRRPPERPVQHRLHALLHPRRPPALRGGRRGQQDLQAADGGPHRWSRWHAASRRRSPRSSAS